MAAGVGYLASLRKTASIPMQEMAAEYCSFGVENIWIIDPEPRIAYRYVENALLGS